MNNRVKLIYSKFDLKRLMFLYCFCNSPVFLIWYELIKVVYFGGIK